MYKGDKVGNVIFYINWDFVLKVKNFGLGCVKEFFFLILWFK